MAAITTTAMTIVGTPMTDSAGNPYTVAGVSYTKGAVTGLAGITTLLVNNGSGVPVEVGPANPLVTSVPHGLFLKPFSAAPGLVTSRAISLNNTPAVVKTTKGNVYGMRIYNPNSSVAYYQIYDAAVGSITMGSTVPKETVPVPAGGFRDIVSPYPLVACANAITHAATANADGSGSALASGLIVSCYTA